ncbi:carbohydrate ABC transporter permease [Streptomyces griseoviridis]|uniref:Carbohydrate ABC transporter permease n=2 Tax=Streptomyces TaxID=1883 RepID=A0A3S9Z5J7_STRGD|nr:MULTISPECIES: carbohydrate ABC transporter permease [Streptomyces]AZS83044.1 carbohydrate ABC transporter permease [Streptomyces griseoviridis]MDH6695758.1 multiple sugar transport system permease protein [Streptomyces sp. MAA16]MDT0470604.1 carbohydrate ABC transporter permease [Streptomyces sp. DSM 41014]QCN90103.1 sugar ABC transporter permease [Streptomyces griseoviridis]
MNRPRTKLSAGRIVAWTLLGIALLLTVFPFYWMIRTSLTPAADIYSDSTGLVPDHPTMINFLRVLGLTSEEEARAAGGSGAQVDFLRYLLNSVVYSGLIAVLQTLFCAMAGYAFARLRFPGRDLVFGVLIAALMVPPIFTVLPNFVLVKNLGLLNTFAGMVAPSVLMTPFAVFFLRQFFLSIPRDVEEAATLDGVGAWGIFWRIVMPMSRGPLITIGLTTTVWSWKDYLWPLLTGREDQTRVLTVALGIFQQQSPNTQPDWTGLMAGSTLSVLPVLVLLIVLGRRLVESLNFTGIK